MDNLKSTKSGWRRKKSSEKQPSNKEKDTPPTTGCELDFIADGITEKPEKVAKVKKNKLKDKALDNKDKNVKKYGRSKSTTSTDSKTESSVNTLALVTICTDDYITKKNEELSQLKKCGSMTPKLIEEIRKLENLINSIKCYRDALSTLTKMTNSDIPDLAYNTSSEDILSMIGLVKLGITGVKEFSKFKSGDHCEALFIYGNKKYKMKGSVKSENDISWNPKEIILQLMDCDVMTVKILESKMFGKMSSVGSAVMAITNLITAGKKELGVALDKDSKMELIISYTWMPFLFNLIPPKYIVKADSNANIKNRQINKNEKIDDAKTVNNEIVENSQASEITFDNSIILGNEKLENAFIEKLQENAKEAVKSLEPNAPENLEEEVFSQDDTDKIIWVESLILSMVLNYLLDDYRGRYTELQLLETMVLKIIKNLQNYADIHLHYIFDEIKFVIESHDTQDSDILNADELNPRNILKRFSKLQFKDEEEIGYRAISAHLKYIIEYLRDIGSYEYLNIKEVIALHKLDHQGKILKLILDIGFNPDMELEDIPQLVKRRILLELWRSCCDGETDLCVSSKILCLEFESEYGREVKRKHPDVANKIFPELVRRIIGLNIEDMDDFSVTIFQLLRYSEEMSTEGEIEDFSKTVDKLALEMFLTSTLQSGNSDLILIAIKKVGTLLALRTSNLCALSHLLLNVEKMVRAAAAAHIMHIGKDVSLRDKALVSYAELLESDTKLDRQSSCIALGFLGGRECIPQLMQLYHCDDDLDVREAAAHALTSIGDEGKLALEHASSTLLAQTMTQKKTMKIAVRLGTAL